MPRIRNRIFVPHPRNDRQQHKNNDDRHRDGQRRAENECPRIAVHATEKIIHPEVSHQHCPERPQTVSVKKQRITKPDNAPSMQRQGIQHQRNERPHLFRIPTPVTAPRRIRPYGSDKNTGDQQEKRPDKATTVRSIATCTAEPFVSPQHPNGRRTQRSARPSPFNIINPNNA